MTSAPSAPSESVSGIRGGDDRASGLEYRPKEVALELVIVDHDDVNPS